MRVKSVEKCQNEKTSFFMPKLSKKAQEEMVGFAVILILIAIIFVVILGIKRGNTDQTQVIEDAKSTSFLNALLETSTVCEDGRDYLTVKSVAFECASGNSCDNNLDSCEVLSESIEDILEVSLDTESATKAYEFQIVSGEKTTLNLSEGEVATMDNFKGASQSYVKNSREINFYIKIYY